MSIRFRLLRCGITFDAAENANIMLQGRVAERAYARDLKSLGESPQVPEISSSYGKSKTCLGVPLGVLNPKNDSETVPDGGMKTAPADKANVPEPNVKPDAEDVQADTLPPDLARLLNSLRRNWPRLPEKTRRAIADVVQGACALHAGDVPPNRRKGKRG